MYEHHITEFGKYTRHEIIHSEKGNRLQLLSDYSGCALSLQLRGVEILDAYQKPIEVDLNRWFKNLPLFPFPNRLDQGQYLWEGTMYQFPVNDIQTGNALHGFSANKQMDEVEVQTEEEQASVHCRYSFDGKNAGFPFPFEFEMRFDIHNTEGVTIELAATNTGTAAMPFGLGWHPYFQLGEAVGRLSLQLPPVEMVGLDEHMIPTGKQYAYDRFRKLAKIGAEVLDNCFRLSGNEPKATLTLASEKHTLSYWQECGEEQFPYLQLFTPPHRQSLAIEPMSCNVNAFNSGDGLWRLEPGERKGARFGFNLK